MRVCPCEFVCMSVLTRINIQIHKDKLSIYTLVQDNKRNFVKFLSQCIGYQAVCLCIVYNKIDSMYFNKYIFFIQLQVRALYKGMFSPMIGMAFINAIVFGVQHNLMKGMERTYLNSFIAGGTAGALQSFICCPMELIKLRIQAQTSPIKFFEFHHVDSQMVYKDPWDAIVQVYKKGGIRGLYKGTFITMAREVPGFGAYFASYDYLCNMSMKIFKNEHRDTIHPLTLCTCGGISGIAAWIVSYPVDVVKSRLQVDGMFDKEIYLNSRDCFRKTFNEGNETGLKRYYIFVRGLNSTMARGFIVNAVTFPTVVLILRYWRKDST